MLKTAESDICKKMLARTFRGTEIQIGVIFHLATFNLNTHAMSKHLFMFFLKKKYFYASYIDTVSFDEPN